MSDNEEWRRELAERLYPNTDWTVRPMPQRAATPIPRMIPINEPLIAPLPGRGSMDSDVAAVDRAAATAHPRPAPIVAEPPQMPEARIWPYVAAALTLLAVAVGWLVGNRVNKAPVAPATAQVAAAPAPAVASARLASPAADDPARCEATLAASALSALVRQGTAFDGQQEHVAAPATLDAVRQLKAGGSTAICRGMLELQLADVRAGSPIALQIISGPVDYAVDSGAGASVPTFRLLRARSIIHRLATIPAAVPVAVAAAAPGAVVPPPVEVERAKPLRIAPAGTAETVLRPPPQLAAAEPLPPLRAVTETAALPATAEKKPPRRAEVEAGAHPAADVAAPPELTNPSDERAADSAAAQAIYGAIARSDDLQAIAAADEGRDLYLRQSRRCKTAACDAVAYERWVTRLRDIDERMRGFATY